MPRLSIEDLKRIRDETRQATALRTATARARVIVHMGTCGISAGSREVVKVLLAEIEKQKLDDVLVTTAGCAGLCSREPMVTVEVAGGSPVKYVDVSPERMLRILREHIQGGNIVTDLALGSGCETTG